MDKVSKSGIIRRFAAVVCESVLDNFGKSVALLSQKVSAIYPGRRYSHNHSTGLFNGAEEGQTFEKTRYCLVDVPDGTTVDQVNAQLALFPEGVIQTVVTNNIQDVLTERDEWAIKNGKQTLDDIMDRHETRDAEGNRYSANQKRVTSLGELLDESLAPEYTRKFYQNTYVDDLDLRVPVLVSNPASTITA